MNQKDYMRLILLLFLIGIAYVPIWGWMYHRWTATDTYYSHGFLIPFISLFLLWKKRAEISEAIKKPQGGRIIFLLAGFFLLFLSAMWRFYFLGGISLLAVLYGLTEYLFGAPLRKLFFFPILYLFFMVPIPEAWIAVINLKLKFFATAIAVWAVDLTGILVVQDGSRIFINEGVMTVGDVCSGLRSLISLLAFGTLFAYICKLPLWKKYFLWIMAFPCAIASNVIRIMALCYVAEWFSVETATGKFHDMSGLGVFVVAFCIMFGIEKVIASHPLKEQTS